MSFIESVAVTVTESAVFPVSFWITFKLAAEILCGGASAAFAKGGAVAVKTPIASVKARMMRAVLPLPGKKAGLIASLFMVSNVGFSASGFQSGFGHQPCRKNGNGISCCEQIAYGSFITRIPFDTINVPVSFSREVLRKNDQTMTTFFRNQNVAKASQLTRKCSRQMGIKTGPMKGCWSSAARKFRGRFIAGRPHNFG
jgi:hypothetical protein